MATYVFYMISHFDMASYDDYCIWVNELRWLFPIVWMYSVNKAPFYSAEKCNGLSLKCKVIHCIRCFGYGIYSKIDLQKIFHASELFGEEKYLESYQNFNKVFYISCTGSLFLL